MPKLLIKKGESVIKKLLIPENIEAFTVGCEKGNDIIIADDAISFFHLQIEKQNTDYFIRDLQSQRGTYVNGKKISNITPLNHLDNIQIGEHSIDFFEESTPAAKAEQPSESAAEKRFEQGEQSISPLEKPHSYHNGTEISREDSHQREPAPRRNGYAIDQAHEEEKIDNLNPDRFLNNGNQNYNSTNEYDIGNIPSDYDISNTYISSDISLNTNTPHISESGNGLPLDSILGNDLESNPSDSAHSTSSDVKDNYYLLCIHGYYLGRKFKIKTPETRIGRDRKLNDIIIKKNSKGNLDQSVSRRHATLKFRKNRWYLSDKRSKSRTWLNRKELGVEDEAKVKLNDEIEIKSDKKSHIFRIVENENWNYSLPRKAGAWHLRNAQKLIYVFSALFIISAIFQFSNAFFEKRNITRQPKNLLFEEELWAFKDLDAKFTNLSNQNFSLFPAAGEVNNDGYLDLIYVNNKGYVSCISGRTKELLWTNTDFKAFKQVPVLLEDLYGKGVPDIIAVSQESRIRIIDGSTGYEINKSPILAGPLSGAPAIGDFNGDGFQDIAITSAQNAIYLALSSIKDFNWTKIDLEYPIKSIISVGDITKDGLDNIFIGTENGKLLVLDGLGKRIMNQVDINEELNKAIGTFGQDNQIRYPIAISDVNGDTTPDLVVSTEQGNLIALSGVNINRLWCDITVVDTSTTFEQGNSAISSGDLDGDGLSDIIVKSGTGNIKAIKSANGSKDRIITLWEHHYDQALWGNPVLVDFNKNGTMDVLVTTQTGIMTIFEGASGQIISAHDAGTKIESHPLIGNFDNDNYLDVLFLKSDGKFYKLRSNSSIPNNAVIWGQAYGNGHNTNISLYKSPDIRQYYAKMSISFFIILLVLTLNYLVIRSRRKLSYY